MADSAPKEPRARCSTAWATLLLLTLLLGGVVTAPAPPAHAATELAPAADWRPERFTTCGRGRCSFEDDSGRNIYVLSGGWLERLEDGGRVYRSELTRQYERVLLAGISPAANQLVVAVGRQRVAVSGRSSLSREPSIHPKEVERSHRLAVLNPKSGELIKSIDLGAYRPRDLAVSDHGRRVLTVGDDLHLNRREVRVYNTRSGRLEVVRNLPPREAVVLGSDGVLLGRHAFRLVVTDDAGRQRFSGRDPYSIAEYLVECGSGRLPDEPTRAFGVGDFEGADPEVSQMLTSALTSELSRAGLPMAERQGLDAVLDEQWLQTTGATDADTAGATGRLTNAHILLLGALRETGTTSSLTVRAVSVETGSVETACEVLCRDCRHDDYREALEYLVRVWMHP